MCHGKQMKHRIGTATHGYIQCHGIHECFSCGNAPWQHTFVTSFIVGESILHHLTGCSLEQLYTIGMSSEDSAITGQRQTDSFRQGVHRIGRKHSRATAATRTSTTLYLSDILIRHLRIGTFHHGCDQVGILTAPPTGFHRTTRTEHRGDIQSHGGHQHTRSHLVTIRDADHSVCLMGIHHVFHRVGDDISRR